MKFLTKLLFKEEKISAKDLEQNTSSIGSSAPIVSIGSLKHNTSALISHDFVYCSALIFDFGEEIIMAHVLPVPAPIDNPVYLGNVFQKIIEKAKEYNLKLLDSQAIIHSGTREDMRSLKSGISQFKIPLKSASFSSSTQPSRTVFYDPRESYLEIRRTNDQDVSSSYETFEKEE
ncbi:hypothetical protein ISS08_00420 [Candidatus Pacearchaeota archaeon]|nr:hypothetical protein [Candidatus Pacearchaeota archaeon]